MLDDRTVTSADDVHQDTFIWSRHNNAFSWQAYLAQTPGTQSTPKYASPGRIQI